MFTNEKVPQFSEILGEKPVIWFSKQSCIPRGAQFENSPPTSCLKYESPAPALDDGDAAMGARAALQGRLGLHLPTAGVKGEDPVGAFPVIIPPAEDVDFPITHLAGPSPVLSRSPSFHQPIVSDTTVDLSIAPDIELYFVCY